MVGVWVRHVAAALGLAGLITATEYGFRHYVMFWMPTLGTLVVNDMVALLLAYAILTLAMVAVRGTRWRAEVADVAHAVRAGVTSPAFTAWLVALVLGAWAFSRVDRLLWGSVTLPMMVSTHRHPAVWLASVAPVLKVAALLAVNGVFIAVAEEYLWRGTIQPWLRLALPAPLAIGLTAVLFSLKHAIVDASPGRLATLAVFGAVCGTAAHGATWARSAALHLMANTLLTVTGLVIGVT